MLPLLCEQNETAPAVSPVSCTSMLLTLCLAAGFSLIIGRKALKQEIVKSRHIRKSSSPLSCCLHAKCHWDHIHADYKLLLRLSAILIHQIHLVYRVCCLVIAHLCFVSSVVI